MKEIKLTLSDYGLDALSDISRRVDRPMVRVFDEALTLYEWAISETENARRIGSIDPAETAFTVLKFEPLEGIWDRVEQGVQQPEPEPPGSAVVKAILWICARITWKVNATVALICGATALWSSTFPWPHGLFPFAFNVVTCVSNVALCIEQRRRISTGTQSTSTPSVVNP